MASWRLGDDLQFLPSGLEGRVRGLQNHRRQVDRAFPGARTAVNVVGRTCGGAWERRGAHPSGPVRGHPADRCAHSVTAGRVRQTDAQPGNQAVHRHQRNHGKGTAPRHGSAPTGRRTGGSSSSCRSLWFARGEMASSSVFRLHRRLSAVEQSLTHIHRIGTNDLMNWWCARCRAWRWVRLPTSCWRPPMPLGQHPPVKSSGARGLRTRPDHRPNRTSQGLQACAAGGGPDLHRI